ncbi:MAG: CDP-alcohol phosphatidyltransferase family protein [Bacteroidota bacterium]|nr:CDP-alcohol phosphatidyltransferase family protein [Bacteroidota bacterium]
MFNVQRSMHDNQRMPRQYSYKDSVKSNVSDEIVNVYLQRPVAGILTRILFPTRVTPNQVTLASTMFGAAGGILLAVSPSLIFPAVCFYLKDILDSADGQLARAKNLYTRRGRFWDSLGDFLVNLFLFGGIFFFLKTPWGLLHPQVYWTAALLMCMVGFLGVNLRVSYQVYYQTMFLHREQKYENNRATEELQEKDLSQDRLTLALQKIFLALYGWQDEMMKEIDGWCRNGRNEDVQLQRWYAASPALSLNKLFGMGTEFVTLTVCLLLGSVWTYLLFSLVVFNCLWLAAILYRKFIFALSLQ